VCEKTFEVFCERGIIHFVYNIATFGKRSLSHEVPEYIQDWLFKEPMSVEDMFLD